MRYYLFTVQFNKEAGAENRTVPKAFNSLNEAIAEFHSQLSKDMKNPTLGWSLAMIINSDGGVHMQEKYVADVVEEPVIEE